MRGDHLFLHRALHGAPNNQPKVTNGLTTTPKVINEATAHNTNNIRISLAIFIN